MKVYLAMRGDDYDSSVLRVFARKEDADAYELADFVVEEDVTESRVDVRPWHTLTWNLREDSEPYVRTRWQEFNDIVHRVVRELHGSISAEHGVGIMKRDEITHYKPPVEIELMRRIKCALDPRNIMNPGKVVRV